MNGKHAVKVSDKRVRYSFELVRNITVVQGNSGTGKTTLFDMISAYARLKERSGVLIVCDKACVALYADSDWQARLGSIHDSIVFIDEDAEYIASHAFASSIRHTDNYYVIFCRESLHELPYSVEEIYEIKTSKRLHFPLRGVSPRNPPEDNNDKRGPDPPLHGSVSNPVTWHLPPFRPDARPGGKARSICEIFVNLFLAGALPPPGGSAY